MLLVSATLGATVALAGCAGTQGPASVLGGECKIFERPEYVILGKRKQDQDWIDSNIEGGVGGCGWQRPKPRPPEWDQPRGRAPAKAAPAARPRGVLRRAADRVLRRRPAAPAPGAVEPLPRPPAAPLAPAAPVQTFDRVTRGQPTTPAPAPPRDDDDDLLKVD